jgi:hypothetical protein
MTDEASEVFELIDLTSGNVVNDFVSLRDALEAIRRLAEAHGGDTVGNLALLRLDGDEQSLVAMQASLQELAASMEHASAAAR